MNTFLHSVDSSCSVIIARFFLNVKSFPASLLRLKKKQPDTEQGDNVAKTPPIHTPPPSPQNPHPRVTAVVKIRFQYWQCGVHHTHIAPRKTRRQLVSRHHRISRLRAAAHAPRPASSPAVRVDQPQVPTLIPLPLRQGSAIGVDRLLICSFPIFFTLTKVALKRAIASQMRPCSSQNCTSLMNKKSQTAGNERYGNSTSKGGKYRKGT
jgi:hypothetical protein